MAFRFGDSFSHYNTSEITMKWTSLTQAGSGSACTILATGSRTGAGAMKVVTGFLSQTFAQKTLTSEATWTIGAAINLTVGHNVGLIFVLDGSTRQIGLAVNTSGTLYIEKNGTTLATSTNALVSGWNYIELTMTFNSGSGSAGVQVNGASWLTFSGNITHTANNSADSVCLGDWIGPSGSQTVLYCDFYANDGTTSVNNTFLGDLHVVATIPTGNGNYTSFAFTGAGSAHAAVADNPPDGDTSYVFSSVATNRETFNFAAPSGTIQDAFALQTVLDVRKDGTGTKTIAASLRIGGTDYDGSTVAISTSYVFYVEPRSLNPSTSAAWVAADFAAIEAGLEIVS